MITFALFVWFTMRFVWPPITKALEERRNKIAEGLASAERGKKELELARYKALQEIKEAKLQAADIVEKAHRRVSQMLDDAKKAAQDESARLIQLAQDQITQEVNQAKETLRQQVSALAVLGAEKILERQVDKNAHQALFDKLVEEIGA